MNPSSRKEAVVAKAIELGFDACGVTSAVAPETASRFLNWLAGGRHGEMAWIERNAARRVNPDAVLPGARSVVMLAAGYQQDLRGGVVDRKPATGTGGRVGVIARYARYPDYHDVLAGPLRALSGFLAQLGGAETRSLWYVDTGPVLERDLAQRAGLGFIGKHTNLIRRDLGNWFFLAAVLTTLELEPDTAARNRCGSCARCLAACPTQAIVAPFELDARRCISYLTIELKGAIPEALRPAIGARVFGCDDCLAVCPWNRWARAGRLMRAHARSDLATGDLLEWLALDGAGFKHAFAGTPILRTKRRGFLRNVCVALGNVGGPECLPALQRAARDPEPLVAGHAQWAIRRIQERGA
ncbi:MAG: tRNA epoxyqueuosine(34) reductase QueG [Verrucomicrobiales bacterium]|nr:tRNA epoxyqueuosine(34) reductase QueG [Verrucomicrobiales bacterium]MCP5527909.1 tRNA epoxyqueuosine(34) reductase QueG [Verrucomicrobiales bacterium]